MQQTYIAFLRGINVGGNKLIKMVDLIKAFESLGFTNVQTILASGNVIFTSEKLKREELAKKIEKELLLSFKTEIGVLIRTGEEIQSIIKADPFNKITVTPTTRLYVTFLSEEPPEELQKPYTSPEKDYQVLGCSDKNIFSLLIISDNKRTTQLLNQQAKILGKKITTRNWNTVKKIAAKI